MTALVLAVTLVASPNVKLALPDIQGVGLDAKLTAFFGEYLATQLKLTGMDVVTSREISSLLGLERQAALLGCSEKASSCMAELASALGADAVILADVARLGEKTQLNLKAISASDGRTLSLYIDRVQGDEAVADSLTRGAQQLSKDLLAVFRKSDAPVVVAESKSGGGVQRFWWAPVALGGVVALAGTVVFGLGKVDYARLTTGTGITASEAGSLRDGGSTKQGAGVALIATGVALVAAGIVVKLVGSSEAPQIAAIASHEGGAVIVTGAFP